MNSILRTLIVDDEEIARERLRDLLAPCHNVKVIGEADSVAHAAALCADLRPDLIFLDVQMPKGDGFSLLEKLDPLPAIIFVTAYDKYALRAFEVNAVDYLLKPVNRERLAHALERVVHRPILKNAGTFSENDRIFLKSDSRTRVVHVTEISGIEAKENYSNVVLANGAAEFLRKGITEWEKCLPSSIFLRVHRSLMVNLKCVQKVSMIDRDNLTVEMAGFPGPVPLGRKASALLRKALRQLDKV